MYRFAPDLKVGEGSSSPDPSRLRFIN